jgi:hypothetical protein
MDTIPSKYKASSGTLTTGTSVVIDYALRQAATVLVCNDSDTYTLGVVFNEVGGDASTFPILPGEKLSLNITGGKITLLNATAGSIAYRTLALGV